jgi:outer membrane protein assembly factor BamB
VSAWVRLAGELHQVFTRVAALSVVAPGGLVEILNALASMIFPAIRELPKVKWQTRLGSTWLMPPLISHGVLYTGGGEDEILYTLDLQTGEKLWATGGFGSMESTGVIAGDIIVAGGYSNLVQALNRLAGEALWSFNANTLYKVLRLSWMRSSTLRPIMLAMLWICILSNKTIDFWLFLIR